MARKAPKAPLIHPNQAVWMSEDTRKRLAEIAATFPVRMSVGKLVELAVQDCHEKRCGGMTK